MPVPPEVRGAFAAPEQPDLLPSLQGCCCPWQQNRMKPETFQLVQSCLEWQPVPEEPESQDWGLQVSAAGAVQLLVKVDNDNAKLLTLIGIMNTDKLFFEFVYEVYRGKIILGEKTIEDRDMNAFFDDKAAQSEEVSSWTESAVTKLKRCYLKNLADAGLLESTKTREIKHALVNYRIEELLASNGMSAYISAIKGV